MLFRLYAVQRGAASRIRPGTYQVQAPITPKELVDTLVRGVADKLIAITIPEGKTFVEIADLLDAAGHHPQDRLHQHRGERRRSSATWSCPAPRWRGTCTPTPTGSARAAPAAEVATFMVRRHKQVYQELKGQYGAGLDKLKQTLGFEDKHVVTLASIVEKETGRADERPRIAQVLINRLTLPNFKPRILQTDPTIIYGCTVAPLALGKASPACQKFKNNNIQRIHLNDRENEYNTYTNEGLPPGPSPTPAAARWPR